MITNETDKNNEMRINVMKNMKILRNVGQTVGFLAGEDPSGTSVGVSGFFRLIKWLISFGFSWTSSDADALAPPAAADDEPASLFDDSGMGFIILAISRFTSSSD